MAANTHRLSILTRHEIDELYALPRLTEEDRHAYFELGEAEQQLMHSRSAPVAAHLILQLGNFKAKYQFFYDLDAVKDDLRYILARHFPDRKLGVISPPSAPTRRALQYTILELFDFRLCDSGAKAELERRAQRLAMLSTQPTLKSFGSRLRMFTWYIDYKLQRMPIGITRLCLLCFAYHRFRQINDNLIEAFIHLVNQYEKSASHAADEAAQNALTEASTHLKAAGQVLQLFFDDSIPRHASFASVKKRAFLLLPLERFEQVSNYMSNIAFDKTGFEWSHYAALSRTIKRNIRHLFVGLKVTGRVSDAPLLEAVACLQETFRSGKSPQQCKPAAFPTAVIPKGLQPYLYSAKSDKKKQLDVDRYEFLVYRLLRNALEAGDVFSNSSNEFRRYEDDLISDARWQQKDAILRDIGSPVLLAPIEETLAALHDDIEA